MCFNMRAAAVAVLSSLALTAVAGQANADHRDNERAYWHGYEDGQRDAVIVGGYIPHDKYRILGPGRYYEDYGHRLDDRYWYAQAYDGSRVLIDAASGVIVDVLSEAAGVDSYRHTPSGYQIPPGHYPPPGLCRVWFPGRPPGHQPPPGSCNVRVPAGAVLVRG